MTPLHSMTAPQVLADAVWPQVRDAVLLVPVGSLEQHGPHLPLDTDTRIAVAVACAAATRLAGSVVAPALDYGASGEHEAFPGTVSIGTAALAHVLVELVRSATRTFSRVVVVNGHGGNLDGLTHALHRLRAEGRTVGSWSATVPGGDAHAGRTETSLLLAIAPHVVRQAAVRVGCTQSLDALLPRLRRAGVRAVSANGVLGDPRGASAAEGRMLLEALVDRFVVFVNAFRTETA